MVSGVCGSALAQTAGAQTAAAGQGAQGSVLTGLASFVLAAAVLVGLLLAGVLRPGALGKNGLRQLGSQPWWVWLVCGVMVFCSMVVGGSLAALVPGLAGPPPAAGADPPIRFEAVTNLCGYVVALGVAAALVRLMLESAPECGLRITAKSPALGIGWLAMTLPLVFATGIVAVAIEQLRTHQPIPSRLAHPVLQTLSSNQGSVWSWVLGFISVVLAPIQEELVFRGFLQSSVLRLTGRPWLSILIAGLIFAAAHLGADMPWYAIVPVFVLGLMMGLAFEKTRSIGTSMTMHVGFNAVNVAMALLGG